MFLLPPPPRHAPGPPELEFSSAEAASASLARPLADANNHRQLRGTEDRLLLDRLRAEGRAAVPLDRSLDFSPAWPGSKRLARGRLTIECTPEFGEYVRDFSARMHAAIAREVEAAAAARAPLPPLQKEVAAHWSAALARSAALVGRDGDLEAIAEGIFPGRRSQNSIKVQPPALISPSPSLLSISLFPSPSWAAGDGFL